LGESHRERASRAPRFSIIVTFHNQRQFIKDALDSALSQQKAEFEVIVVDDASVDGSQETLKQYGDAIRLLCLQENVGASAARNRGAAAATGEYLVFLDGDDAFLPWAL
jgi:glycosyltransferase involved in cell wall biosynthesis